MTSAERRSRILGRTFATAARTACSESPQNVSQLVGQAARGLFVESDGILGPARTPWRRTSRSWLAAVSARTKSCRRLGAGGMGEVYRARDERLDRIVALKILAPDRSNDPEFRDRLRREARALSRSAIRTCARSSMSAPRAVRDYFVMELLAGETLAERLHADHSPSTDFRVGRQIASALETSHRGGLVHRDLKPANVMLTPSGVKLLDFGIAGFAPLGSPATSRETATATDDSRWVPRHAPVPCHRTARRARGGCPSDIFQLRRVLYEMITGRRAFAGDSPARVTPSILTEDPPPILSLQPAAPRRARSLDTKLPGQESRRALAERSRSAASRSAGSPIAFAIPPVRQLSHSGRAASGSQRLPSAVRCRALVCELLMRQPRTSGGPRSDPCRRRTRSSCLSARREVQPSCRQTAVGSLHCGGPYDGICGCGFDSLGSLVAQSCREQKGLLSVLVAGRRTSGILRRRKTEEDRHRQRHGDHLVRGARKPRRRWNRDGTIVFAPSLSSGLQRVHRPEDRRPGDDAGTQRRESARIAGPRFSRTDVAFFSRRAAESGPWTIAWDRSTPIESTM